MNRPTIDEYFAIMLLVVSSRSTCRRRQVGCILVNKLNHVIATGYNGVARGQEHCIDKGHVCPGANSESGSDLDKCYAIHAEQNALLQCRNVNEIFTIYVTHEPCITCTKLFLNTSAYRIAYINAYDYKQVEISVKLWVESGRIWVNIVP